MVAARAGQAANSLNGAHTWSSTPIAGNLLTITSAKTSGGANVPLVAPSGFSTAFNPGRYGNNMYPAIFFKIAAGTESVHQVGGTGGADVYRFEEWEPGAGRIWPTNPVVDTESDWFASPSSTAKTIDLPSMVYGANGVALAAFAPSGNTGSVTHPSGWTEDYENKRVLVSQVLSGSGTIPAATFSWANNRYGAVVGAVFETEADAPAITDRLKIHNGSSWEAKPLKYYDGGWVHSELKTL